MRKNDGMTLISVIVGFAILLIGIAMFYGTIQISNNIVSTQNERLEKTEQLINDYYKKTPSNSQLVDEEGTKLNITDSNISGFKEITVNKYRISIDGAGELYYYEKK